MKREGTETLPRCQDVSVTCQQTHVQSQESWWELRWECLSCSMHLKKHWLTQVPESERKWEKFLLRNMVLFIGASLQWCHNKNCCVTPGFSNLGNTTKSPWFWFYLFRGLMTIEQRDNVTLCSHLSSVNVSLYPRRRWQICKHKEVLALGPYSELCQGELATQVLRNISKIS